MSIFDLAVETDPAEVGGGIAPAAPKPKRSIFELAEEVDQETAYKNNELMLQEVEKTQRQFLREQRRGAEEYNFQNMPMPQRLGVSAMAGGFSGALDLASNVARAGGLVSGSQDLHEAANQLNRGADDMSASIQRRSGDGFLEKAVGGASRSTTNMVPSAMVGGTPGVIGEAAFGAANSAYTRARDAGLDHNKALYYALTTGAIEGGITAAAERFAPGLETMIGRGLAKGTIGEAAKMVARELPEELAIGEAQAIADVGFGVDKDALNVDRQLKMVRDVVGQTAVMGGVGGAARVATFDPDAEPANINQLREAYVAPENVAKVLAGRRALGTSQDVEALSSLGKPSRSQWEKAGLPPDIGSSARTRTAFADEIKKLLDAETFQGGQVAPGAESDSQTDTESDIGPNEDAPDLPARAAEVLQRLPKVSPAGMARQLGVSLGRATELLEDAQWHSEVDRVNAADLGMQELIRSAKTPEQLDLIIERLKATLPQAETDGPGASDGLIKNSIWLAETTKKELLKKLGGSAPLLPGPVDPTQTSQGTTKAKARITVNGKTTVLEGDDAINPEQIERAFGKEHPRVQPQRQDMGEIEIQDDQPYVPPKGRKPISVSAVNQVFPGAQVAKTDRGYRVNMGDSHVDIQFAEKLSLPDKARSYKPFSEMTDEQFKKVQVPATYHIRTDDGAVHDGLGIIRISEALWPSTDRRAGERVADLQSLMHEAAHLAYRSKKLTPQEYAIVTKDYRQEGATPLDVEEAFATAHQNFVDNAKIWEKVKRFFRKLLAGMGIDLRTAQDIHALLETSGFWKRKGVRPSESEWVAMSKQPAHSLKSEELEARTQAIAEREFQAWEKTLSAEQRELMERKYGSYKSALKDFTKQNRAKIVDMALAEMQAGNPVTPIQGPPPAKDVTDPFRKTEGAQWQEVPQNLDEYMRRFKEQYGQDINRAAGPKSDTIHTDDTAVYSLKAEEPTPGPIFFSKMLEVANSAKVGRVFSLDQLLSTLDNAGVKKEEVEDSHIKEHFQGKKKITKDELLEYLGENAVKVEEVSKGVGHKRTLDQPLTQADEDRFQMLVSIRDMGEEFTDQELVDWNRLGRVRAGFAEPETAGPEYASEPKFGQYQLPGGTSYRELLLTVPVSQETEDMRKQQAELGRERREIEREFREFRMNLRKRLASEHLYKGIPPEQAKALRVAQEIQNGELDIFTADHAPFSPEAAAGLASGERSIEEGVEGLVSPDIYDQWRDNMADLDAAQGSAPMEPALLARYTDHMLRQDALDKKRDKAPQPFRSSHWDEPNVLAHLRFNDRTDADGKKVLFIEEIQSDWHQQGRKHGYVSQDKPKGRPASDIMDDMNEIRREYPEISAAIQVQNGYMSTGDASLHAPQVPQETWESLQTGQMSLEEFLKQEDYVDGSNLDQVYFRLGELDRELNGVDRATFAGVPDAPFKKSWPMLAMKRMIRWASENGYDRIAWTPGEEQNKRYGLGQVVNEIRWERYGGGGPYREVSLLMRRADDGVPRLKVNTETGIIDSIRNPPNGTHWAGQPLSALMGEELAGRVLGESTMGHIRGQDLEVGGGEGMKGFYDQILPAETNKIIKKYGARVGKTVIGEEPKPSPTKRGKVIEVTDPSGELMWQAMIGDQKVGPPERLRVDAGHYLVDALSARGDKLTIIPVVDEDNPGDHPREYEYEATPTGWDRIEGNTLPPTKVHAFDITPSMRKEVVEKGLPVYSLKDSMAQFSGPIKKGLSTAATLAKVKFNKSFFSDIPDEVVKEDLLRQGKVAAELRKMSHIANELQDQLIRERGNRDLTEPELKVLDDALKGEKTAIQKLTPKIAEAIGKMRHHIKQLSLKFIASGLTDGDLAMTIVENMESYVTRSYRKFDDPDWAKKILPEVRAAAHQFIRSEFPKLSDHEINNKIDDLLYEKDAPLALIKASKLGSKDLTVLMKRQDIPAPIRALMGEYHHPFVNYMRSVARMSNTLASHDFLVEAREAGMGVYFWDRNDPKRPTGFNAELANKDDKTMRPLAGVMTTPEIAKAFQDAYKRQPEVESVLLRTFFAATGLAKYMKTVGNFPMGYLRNFMSNAETLAANGNLHYITPSRMRQAAGSVSEDVRADLPATARVLADWAGKESYKRLPQWAQKFFKFTAEQWQADTERMVRLHVYDESVHANELRDAIRDVGASSLAGLEGMTEYTTNKFLRNAQKTAASASSLYQAMDNFWRRIHFEAERAKYKAAKKGLTDDQLDLIAADNVRRTFHTYSMIPPVIKQLRRVPLIAPFVSFTSETIRTKAASLRLAWEEMQDPDLKRIGQVRMASNVASLMAVPTLAMAVRYLLGYDWEDDQNLREFVPPWSRNSDILFLPGGTKDNPKWVDMSYTSPSSYLRKPVYALLRNENPDVALREAFQEIKEPFFGEELLWEKMTDISRNSTDDGVRIWGPADSNLERMTKQTTHLLSSLEPGTISSLRRIEKARTGFVEPSGRTYKTSTEYLAPLTGFRVNDTDISVAIKNASRVYSRQIPEITVDFTRMVTGPGTTTPDDVKQGYLSMNAKREQHFRQMTRRVEAAINSGVPEEEIYSSMLEVGIGKDAARALLANYYQPYVLSDEALKKMRKLKDGQARYEAYLKGYQEASEALTKSSAASEEQP